MPRAIYASGVHLWSDEQPPICRACGVLEEEDARNPARCPGVPSERDRTYWAEAELDADPEPECED